MADADFRPDDHPDADSGGRRSPRGTSYGDWVPDRAQAQVTPPRHGAEAAEPGAGWGRERADDDGAGVVGTTGGPDGARDGPPGASAPDLSGDAFGAEDPGAEGLVAGATPTGGTGRRPRAADRAAGARAPTAGLAGAPRSRGSGLGGQDVGGDRYQRFVDDFARWRRIAAAAAGARPPGASSGSSQDGNVAAELAERSSVPGLTTPGSGPGSGPQGSRGG